MIESTVRSSIGDDPPSARLLYGTDVRSGLRSLREASVHVVVTSPPYWGLRSYLAAGAEGKESEIGGEETVEAFVENLVGVFREVARVLRKDGTVWLNLGDSYAGGGRAGKNPEYWQKHTSFGKADPVVKAGGFGLPSAIPEGLKAKDMVGVPWRVAFALQKDGWYLRAACPWVKRNVMPESCTDRPSAALEHVFLLAHPESGGHYYYDVHAARAPLAAGSHLRLNQPTFARQTGGEKDYGNEGGANANRSARKGVENLKSKLDAGDATRQRRASDWFYDSLRGILAGEQGLLANDEGDPLALVVNPKPYAGAHFAVFPERLVEPCLLSSTSAGGCCPSCGAQWARVVEKAAVGRVRGDQGGLGTQDGRESHGLDEVDRAEWAEGVVTRTTGWEPGCACGETSAARPVVMDIFSGSATTGMVALQNGRDYVGLDLNPEYLPLAEARLRGTAPPSVDTAGVDEGSALDLFGGAS